MENVKYNDLMNKLMQVDKSLGIELNANIRTWASTGDEA